MAKITFDDICKYIPFPYGSLAKGAWKMVPPTQQEEFLNKVNELAAPGLDPEKRDALINQLVDKLVVQIPAVEPHKDKVVDALKKVIEKSL